MKSGWSELSPSERRAFGLVSLGYILLFFWSRNFPFFADGVVQSSMAGQFFLDQGYEAFFLPEDQSPGHPPFWGIYLSLWWLLLDEQLWVAHLACLPFLIMGAYQFLWVGRFWVSERFLPMLLLLFFFEPTGLAQSTQVLPDLAMMALFFLGLRGILYERSWMLVLAGCCLPLLNTRGTMLVAVLGLLEIGLFWINGGKGLPWKKGFKYVLPLAVALLWMYAFYLHVGWLGFNREDMPWRDSFIPVDFRGWLRNLGVIGWRFLDFGRVTLWGVLLFFLFRRWRSWWSDRRFTTLLWVVLVQLIIFLPVTTRYIGTMQHRYFLPVMLLSLVLLVFLLQEFWKRENQQGTPKWVVAFIVFSFLTGHFWIYPDKVSQGWDASLAHVHYFHLRKEMLNDLHESGLNPNEIPTGTPNKYRLKYTDLEDADWKFPDHTEVTIKKYPMVLYSNVSNDFDSVYATLHEDWILLKEWKQMGIVLRLFKNPEINKLSQ